MAYSKNQNRDSAVDLLRAVAVLAVVLIHTTTRTLEASEFDISHFGFSLFLNQISRFAAPLFFAVSGFVLELNSPAKIDPTPYFKKRLAKIVLPYLFWSLVYYLFVYRTHAHGFITALLLGDASYQLYFIPSILILYCLFPFIHKWFNQLTTVGWLCSLGLAQVLLLFYDYYVHPINLSAPVTTVLLNFFIFFLGIVAARNRSRLIQAYKKLKVHWLSAVLPLSIFIFLEGRARYLLTGNYLSFYSQWRPDVLIYTILVGWLLYGFFSTRPRFFQLGRTLSRLSYFVFFCHVAVLEFVWKFIGPNFASLGFDLYFFLSVALISTLTAFLVHKLPKLSLFTG